MAQSANLLHGCVGVFLQSGPVPGTKRTRPSFGPGASRRAEVFTCSVLTETSFPAPQASRCAEECP